MNISHIEQYRLVEVAQNHFCKYRADEICEDPFASFQALIEAFSLHPIKTVKVFDAVRKSGRVCDLLALEDLLRKSAETIADSEWRKKQ